MSLDDIPEIPPYPLKHSIVLHSFLEVFRSHDHDHDTHDKVENFGTIPPANFIPDTEPQPLSHTVDLFLMQDAHRSAFLECRPIPARHEVTLSSFTDVSMSIPDMDAGSQLMSIPMGHQDLAAHISTTGTIPDPHGGLNHESGLEAPTLSRATSDASSVNSYLSSHHSDDDVFDEEPNWVSEVEDIPIDSQSSTSSRSISFGPSSPERPPTVPEVEEDDSPIDYQSSTSSRLPSLGSSSPERLPTKPLPEVWPPIPLASRPSPVPRVPSEASTVQPSVGSIGDQLQALESGQGDARALLTPLLERPEDPTAELADRLRRIEDLVQTLVDQRHPSGLEIQDVPSVPFEPVTSSVPEGSVILSSGLQIPVAGIEQPRNVDVQPPLRPIRSAFPTPGPVPRDLYERERAPTAPPTIGGDAPPTSWYHPPSPSQSTERPPTIGSDTFTTSWYRPARRGQPTQRPPTHPTNIPDQQSAGPQPPTQSQEPNVHYVPMPPDPMSVNLPPFFASQMEILRENRLGQLATVDQQRELMKYMRGLNDWLERDVYNRQSEFQGVVARLEQLGHDIQGIRAQLDKDPRFPQTPPRYPPVILPVVPETTGFQGPVILTIPQQVPTFPDQPGPAMVWRPSEGGSIFISSPPSRHSTSEPRPTSPPVIPRPYLADLGSNVIEIPASTSSSSGSSTDRYRRKRGESYGSRPTSRTESRGRRHTRTSHTPSPIRSSRPDSRRLVVTNPSEVPAVVPDPHGLPEQYLVHQRPPSSTRRPFVPVVPPYDRPMTPMTPTIPVVMAPTMGVAPSGMPTVAPGMIIPSSSRSSSRSRHHRRTPPASQRPTASVIIKETRRHTPSPVVQPAGVAPEQVVVSVHHSPSRRSRSPVRKYSSSDHPPVMLQQPGPMYPASMPQLSQPVMVPPGMMVGPDPVIILRSRSSRSRSRPPRREQFYITETTHRPRSPHYGDDYGSGSRPHRHRSRYSSSSSPTVRRPRRRDSSISPPHRRRHDSSSSPPHRSHRRDPSGSPSRRSHRRYSPSSPPHRSHRHYSPSSPPHRSHRHYSPSSPPHRSHRRDSSISPSRRRHDLSMSPPHHHTRSLHGDPSRYGDASRSPFGYYPPAAGVGPSGVVSVPPPHPLTPPNSRVIAGRSSSPFYRRPPPDGPTDEKSRAHSPAVSHIGTLADREEPSSADRPMWPVHGSAEARDHPASTFGERSRRSDRSHRMHYDSRLPSPSLESEGPHRSPHPEVHRAARPPLVPHSTLITAQDAEERREAEFLTQEGNRQHYFEEAEERRNAEARQRLDAIWQELDTRLKALPALTPISQSPTQPMSTQQAASQHASDAMETIRLEREEVADEREALAAEHAQLIAEVSAQKDAIISEKDARITTLEDKLAKLQAELEEERQRVTESSEMRERERREYGRSWLT